MRNFVFCLISGLVIISVARVAKADDAMQILKDAPDVSAPTYRIGRMVRAVNYLRSVGKEKALVALRNYVDQSDTAEQAKVLLICRLLFVNPQGWTPPNLGEPLPLIDENAMKQFPYFPIALSDGVPFLVVKGYRLGGRAESATACIKLCEGFSVITGDLPHEGYQAAAHGLIQSQSFHQLYKNVGDEEEMAQIVLHQAETESRKPDKK